MRAHFSYKIKKCLRGLLLVACALHGETITGRVVGVADGDTITA